jgi:CDP-diacylglycerol---serine O-phosphatidyltransferase
MPPKEKLFAVLPTMLTLGNATCGFGAITFAAKLGPTPTGNLGGNELLIAGALIYLAMLFDAFDGSAARLMNQTSDFGAQLDSLCDAISFGVAPAYLMLQIMVHSFGPNVTPPFNYHPRLLWMIAVLFVLCAILRLARFNVETDEDDSHEFFSGLPSPAAAGVVASFPIGMYGLKDLMTVSDSVDVSHTIGFWVLPIIKLLLPLITLAVAVLMVSRVRYVHVFNHLFRGQRSRRHIIQLVMTVVIIFTAHELALPVIFCYFAFAAPVTWLWHEITRGRLGKKAKA